jgi:hypothetical protein
VPVFLRLVNTAVLLADAEYTAEHHITVGAGSLAESVWQSISRYMTHHATAGKPDCYKSLSIPDPENH